MILKHSILNLLNEHDVITLSEIARKLGTSEGYVLVTVKQMIDSGTPVRLKDDIVYIPKSSWLPYAVASFLLGVIVVLPAWLGLN